MNHITNSPSPERDSLSRGRLALFALLYAVASIGALRNLVSPDGVAALWPASGVFLGALLLTPRRQWWRVAAVLSAIDLSAEILAGGIAVPVALVFTTSLTGQALVSAYLLQRFTSGRIVFASLQQIWGLLLWGCLVPGLAFAVPPTLVASALPDAGFAVNVLAWATSPCLGVVVVTPFMVQWFSRPSPAVEYLRRRRALEFGVALVVVGTTSALVFSASHGDGNSLAPLSYWVFPLIIWVAVRLGVGATAAAGIVMVSTALYADLVDLLTADAPDAFASITALQALLAVAVGVGLTLAAVQAERADALEREQAARRVVGEAEERFRALFQSSPVALWLFDLSPVRSWLNEHPLRVPNGEQTHDNGGYSPDEAMARSVVLDVNPAASELLGVERDKLRGPVVGALSAIGAARAAVPVVLDALVEGKTDFAVSGDLERPGGDVRHVQVEFIVPQGTGGPDYRRVVAAIIDVTEVEEARRQAVELSRLKSRLIATVAHELRTPLTAVVGFSDLLDGGLKDLHDEEVSLMVSDVAASSRQMAGIVEDLLASARAELGELRVSPQRIDLLATAEAALHTTALEGRSCGLHGSDVWAWADAGRVRQIVRNLVTNAIRHGEDPIEVDVSSTGTTATLIVSDAGPSIPAADADRLFDLYWRRESAIETSLGVGLSLSLDLAQRMGGDLVYSRRGNRNAFVLTLPTGP